MNQNEIRWIVENLFIGNKLTRGEAILSDGTPIDLRRIEAPVVVFASHGDNITPPQQALNWIPALYHSVEDLRAYGHVIIYTLHDSIGHLGIFVSAQVANRQHEHIGSVVKTIESLSPGLYEMIIGKDEHGIDTVFFDARSIDDILKLDDGRDEEVDFSAVAKYSEWATKTYELTWRPIIQSLVTPALADMRRQLHPLRQQHYFFSRKNPMFVSIDDIAEQVRTSRTPASADNPFIELERLSAEYIEEGWALYRDIRDAGIELSFHWLYGTPWMKSLGADQDARPAIHDIRNLPPVREAIGKAKIGGYAEGIIRMLVLLARARGSVRRDRLERSNKLLHSRPPFSSMTPEMRSHIIHEQTMVVEFAGGDAVTSLADLLKDPVDRYRALNLALEIAGPVEDMDAPTIAMFKRLQLVLLTMAHDWHEPVAVPDRPAGEQTATSPATTTPASHNSAA
jgi:hypothetical protein